MEIFSRRHLQAATDSVEVSKMYCAWGLALFDNPSAVLCAKMREWIVEGKAKTYYKADATATHQTLAELLCLRDDNLNEVFMHLSCPFFDIDAPLPGWLLERSQPERDAYTVEKIIPKVHLCLAEWARQVWGKRPDDAHFRWSLATATKLSLHTLLRGYGAVVTGDFADEWKSHRIVLIVSELWSTMLADLGIELGSGEFADVKTLAAAVHKVFDASNWNRGKFLRCVFQTKANRPASTAHAPLHPATLARLSRSDFESRKSDATFPPLTDWLASCLEGEAELKVPKPTKAPRHSHGSAAPSLAPHSLTATDARWAEALALVQRKLQRVHPNGVAPTLQLAQQQEVLLGRRVKYPDGTSPCLQHPNRVCPGHRRNTTVVCILDGKVYLKCLGVKGVRGSWCGELSSGK